jgi:WD40 repeat protein
VVATVSDDCSIRIWYPLESDDILCLQGHNERIESLILGTNNVMATTSSDKSIKIWNLSNFMNNFNQGKIIHCEKQPRGHDKDITNICFSIKNSLLFTTSRDGILIIWGCNYENGKLISLNYLAKLEIHSAACTSICVTNETENMIELATGSDDKTVKIWNINITNMSIDMKNTFYETRPVIFLDTIKIVDKNKSKHLLIALECLSTTLFINLFDVNNKYSKSVGCIIHGYTSFIYGAKIIDSSMYITLINDGILKVNLNEITSSFKKYLSHDNKLKKIASRKVLFEKDDTWFTCIGDTENEMSCIAGDCKGNLHKVFKDASDIELIKKIHDSHITDMLNLKLGNNSRLITASQDGSVKIWSSNAEKQLGQYNFNCGITCIKNVSIENDKITIVCADECCDIHILIWHDKCI